MNKRSRGDGGYIIRTEQDKDEDFECVKAKIEHSSAPEEQLAQQLNQSEGRPKSLQLVRVPVVEIPPKLLPASQAMTLALSPGDVVTFGRGKDCTVRTEGPGLQAMLAVDAVGGMVLHKYGSDPAPDARTTKDAPHGLRVVRSHPDPEFVGVTTFVHLSYGDAQVVGEGDTIVFTLHAAQRSCCTIRKN
jgi:hypothetical protein